MRKKLLLLVIGMTLVSVSVASAQIVSPIAGVNTLPQLINFLVKEAANFAKALAVLAIILSGFMYLLSAGNADRIKTAKSWLTFAITGLVLAVLASAITDFIWQAAQGNSAADIINNIAVQVGGLMAGLGTVIFIWAGILWVTSAGNADRIKTAKQAMTGAVIGIALGLLAKPIVDFIISLG